MQQLFEPPIATPPQERAIIGTFSVAPIKGQLLMELVKRVRADPEAIATYGLQDYVRLMFADEDDMVRSVTVHVFGKALCKVPSTCDRQIQPAGRS